MMKGDYKKVRERTKAILKTIIFLSPVTPSVHGSIGPEAHGKSNCITVCPWYFT